MKLAVKSLEGIDVGTVDLDDSIYALEPRADLLHRTVRWQLAKRQAGTHAVKNRADIARTGKKLYRQKGTGGARHGSARVSQFRGGGRAFGPVPRSHAHDLPKKVRALALRHALSSKLKTGSLFIADSLSVNEPKTKLLLERFTNLGITNALFIDGAELNSNFQLAARNIPYIDVLPVQGINVYDILRRHTLVLSRAAVYALEARFK
jgi:large subunit ribosomal protein L4